MENSVQLLFIESVTKTKFTNTGKTNQINIKQIKNEIAELVNISTFLSFLSFTQLFAKLTFIYN